MGCCCRSTALIPAVKLDGMFALHPAMKTFAALYAEKQAIVVHAAASPYRERSHFDGQDVLESGLGGVGKTSTGWLNRATGAIPKGEHINPISAISVGAEVPLVMRGKAPVVTWLPVGFPPASESTRDRLLAIYNHTDAELARALQRGDCPRQGDCQRSGDGRQARSAETAGSPDRFMRLALLPANCSARDDGPRIGSMSFLGWDTHANEKPMDGQLGKLLGSLDSAIEGLKSEMGPVWHETVIVIATEFGRTARMNGTMGTDHGTGTVAFIAGGAVKGGRVVADWPGLAEAKLYSESRSRGDDRPSGDLQGVAA